MEDNALTAETLSAFLRRDGMAVTVAGDGPTAWQAIRAAAFDLILLDVMLPGIDGRELLRRIRQRSAVPVLMLTARTREEDALEGFSLGADDYIRKPYSPKEVVARARRALERGAAPEPPALVVGDLKLETDTCKAWVGERAVALTPSEQSILDCLMRRPGRVVSRETLLELIARDRPEIGDRAVDTHLYNLRRKIEDDPRRPRRLLTEYGLGYRLNLP